MTGDEVGEDLAIGVGSELVAVALQALLQLGEVLDDPVVDDHEVAGRIRVGVGVAIVRLAVRGPPGVPDSDGSRRGIIGEQSRQTVDLALSLGDPDVAVGDRDPGRVVPAVFETPQPVQ